MMRNFFAVLLIYTLPLSTFLAELPRPLPMRSSRSDSPLPLFHSRSTAGAPELDGSRLPSERVRPRVRPISQVTLASLRAQMQLRALAGAGLVRPKHIAPMMMQAGGSNVSTIGSNFNGTAIAAGNHVWFNSVLQASGLGAGPAKITVKNATIQFTAGGVPYTINVPDTTITYSPQVTIATTTYDAVKNQWVTDLPMSFAGNGYLDGVGLLVPSGGLPGGINPVSWTGTFYTDTAGVSVNWKWAAAVYTTLSADLNTLGVKPIDATTGSLYNNSDHAGTPENFKSYVTGGARGGGGSNYTGSYSGTASVVPAVITNNPPVANAGPDQTVFVGATVQLDGSGSTDPDGDPLTYRWAFVSAPTGSTAALSNPDIPNPSFVADQPGSYVVQLVVNDGQVDGPADQVVINTQNSPPVANAGPDQTVTTQSLVQLDGSASTDVDGDALTYSWLMASRPAGSFATLSDPTVVNPTFTADVKGTYVLRLTVNDGHVDSAPDDAVVSTINSAPVANAGPDQSIVVGTTVQLNGSGSTDVDGDTLTYTWSILSTPPGSQAALSDPHAVTPTFFAESIGTYVVQLMVNDGTVDSAADTVTITTGNSAPVANAGPDQSVALGSLVHLDGTGSSDPDGQVLTYQWALASVPAGSTAVLTDPGSPTPAFSADRAGNYVGQLIVNDGYVNSQPDTVVISTINSVPVANAGPDQNVATGGTVHLDGAGSSDADGDPLTYNWAILSQPAGGAATLSGSQTATPTFVPNVAGAYVVQLIVNDGKVNSQPDTAMIVAQTPNQPPTVSAGPDRTIQFPVSTVTLEATVSDDGFPSPDALSAAWNQVSGPAAASFASPNQAVTQASFTDAGTYVLRLTASDTQFTVSSDVTVTVLPLVQNNQPPVVNAGPDQSVTLPANMVTLNGSVADDGLPIGGVLTATWSLVNGPGQVTFASPGQPSTMGTFSAAGVYFLALGATDGQFTSVSTVTITVNPPTNLPPVVSAGPNQAITWPDQNSVTLNGSATDDGAPAGGALTLTWTLVRGPKPVTFGDPGTAVTTATFAGPGTYVLRLTASDSQLSASADVTIFVGKLSCSRSNRGVDFWLTFPGNLLQSTNQDGTVNNEQPTLFLTAEISATGTVTVPGLGFSAPFSVTSGQVTTIALPQGANLTSSDTVEGKGIHIVASNPVTVYGLNYLKFTTDGFMASPTSTLGTDYLVLAYRNNTAFFSGTQLPAYGSEFALVATADQTTVTITPSITTGAHHAGLPYSVVLDQGQTYQLRNDDSPTTLQHLRDLTGSVIQSDKPIALFGGHKCAFVPDGSTFCDNLVEQIPPVESWGTNFVTMPLAARFKGDTFRVLASVDGTHVTINRNPPVTLNRGQFLEQSIQGPVQITADQPVLAAQYSNGISFGGAVNGNADPFMMVLPPYDQFGGNTTVETPVIGFPDNYINLVAPEAAKASLAVDGQPVPQASFSEIGTSGFVGAQLIVGPGAHHITSQTPFQSFVYGYAQQDGYGYSGSSCRDDSEPGTTVTLDPKLLTRPVDAQACFTARVADATDNGLGGADVIFKVLGVNSGGSTVTTDATGQAAFCYTGTRAGSDVVTATLGELSDSASVTWGSNGPNQAPIVNAGANQVLFQPAGTVLLNGSVTDDGLPAGAALTIQWTELSGPAPVTFTQSNQAVTQASFSTAGTYVLELSASDTELSSSSSVTVTVYPPNQAPVVTNVSAGNFFGGGTIYPGDFGTLRGTVTDDGLPAGSAVTVRWSEISGPSTLTFQTPTQTTTTASFPVVGTYVVALTASDGQLTTTVPITVTVPERPLAPSVTLNPTSQTVFLPSQASISASVTSNAGPVTFQWKFYSGPGTVTFSNPTQPSTLVSFTVAGTYQIQLLSTNSAGTTSSVAQVTVVQPSGPPPAASIATIDGSDITKPTAIVGTVSGTWKLESSRLSNDPSVTPVWKQFASGSVAVSNGTLGTFDPTLLLNGMYDIRLTAADSQGQSSSATITVTVRGNTKLGHFQIAFNDLSVPLPGLPITVTRSYDSRDTAPGDFGVGWHLSVANARVQKTRNLGLGWFETVQWVGQFPQYCLQPTRPHQVTITFPDGKVYKFQMVSTPGCQNFAPFAVANIGFTQTPTGSATAGASLVAVGTTAPLVDSDNLPGNVSLLDYNANPVDYTQFQLTTAEGFVYALDQKLGVTQVRDPNGNTLTINANGVFHSGGQSIVFHRDNQSRVTQITDPNGKGIRYEYTDTNDLADVVDRQQNITNFAYNVNDANFPHFLLAISQPNQPAAANTPSLNVLTNVFDPTTHRLVSETDANQTAVRFSYDLTNQRETITDRTNAATVYQYDDDGNIVRVTDALGGITTSTYDANDNKLSETNALGKTTTYTYDAVGNRLTETDPLGHQTSFTYNQRKQVLTVRDPLGHVTTNTYDQKGNLLSTRDALGSTTSYTYLTNGLPETVTDAASGVTRFAYAGSSNPTRQTDALGSATTYTYDANGNRLSQSVTRTVGGVAETLTTGYT